MQQLSRAVIGGVVEQKPRQADPDPTFYNKLLHIWSAL